MPPFRGDTARLGTSSQTPEAFQQLYVTAKKGAPELNQVAEEGLARSQGTSCSSRRYPMLK